MTKREKTALKVAKAKAEAAKAQARADKLQKKANSSKAMENFLIFAAIVGMVSLAITAAIVSLPDEE